MGLSKNEFSKEKYFCRCDTFYELFTIDMNLSLIINFKNWQKNNNIMESPQFLTIRLSLNLKEEKKTIFQKSYNKLQN
jgi:hypothetical protein